MPSNDLYFSANYTINEYILRYIYEEEVSWYYHIFEYGSDLTNENVDDPTKTGNDFGGWDTVRPDTMPAYDVIINPIFTPRIYTVEYLDWDGSLLNSFDVAYEADLNTLNVEDANRIGYTFLGWDLSLPTTMPNNDITINATYQINTYNITYHIDGGISGSNPGTYQVDTTTITLDNPQKDGYTFGGYYDNDLLVGTAITEIVEGTYDDLDLYVKWNAITYDITYYLDGGSNGSNPSTYQIDSPTIILDNPTKIGYTFIGFYENASYTGDTITEISMGSFEDINLYVKWNVNSYDIDYVIYDYSDPITDILLHEDETIELVALGGNHSALVTSEGRVFTWGFNAVYGQLGTGDNVNSTSPVEITTQFGFTPGEFVIDISLGYNFSAVITNEGRVFTWGEAYDGQLGNGGETASNVPIDITTQFGFNTGEKPTQISLGTDHTGLVTSEGRLFTWGYNNQGQLGNNTTTKSNIPIDITSSFGLNTNETITDFVTSSDFNIAVTSDLRVFTWGNNSNGQLGTKNIIQYKQPIDITDNFNFNTGISLVDIDTGSNHSSLVVSNGVIYMWGNNTYGQLGDDTTVFKNTPTAINSQFQYLLNFNEKLIDIELGDSYTIAVTSEGRVFSWGIGLNGETGYGGFYNRKTPQNITSNFNLLTGETVSFITAGFHHTMAVTNQSKLYLFGSNSEGELGNGDVSNIAAPTLSNFKGLYCVDIFSYDFDTSLTAYNPVRTGYTITEWYIDSDMTTLYTFTTMPAEDLVLYGRWSKVE